MVVTTAMPETAKISLVAMMGGAWVAALMGILGSLIGNNGKKAARAQDILYGAAAGSVVIVALAAFVFFGLLIVAAAQMFWG